MTVIPTAISYPQVENVVAEAVQNSAIKENASAEVIPAEKKFTDKLGKPANIGFNAGLLFQSIASGIDGNIFNILSIISSVSGNCLLGDDKTKNQVASSLFALSSSFLYFGHFYTGQQASMAVGATAIGFGLGLAENKAKELGNDVVDFVVEHRNAIPGALNILALSQGIGEKLHHATSESSIASWSTFVASAIWLMSNILYSASTSRDKSQHVEQSRQ